MNNDTIVYLGKSDYIPDDIDSFTQISINEVFTLDENLPEIDEILKVSVLSNIKNSKIVKTGKGKSLEGQILTGYKSLNELEFIIRIDYLSDSLNEGIFSYQNNINFSNATNVAEDINENYITTNSIFIEDIYANKLSERDFLLNINYIFTVEMS